MIGLVDKVVYDDCRIEACHVEIFVESAIVRAIAVKIRKRIDQCYNKDKAAKENEQDCSVG